MAVKARPQHMHDGCRRKAKRNTQGDRVPDIFTGLADPAGTKGARDRGDEAATDRTLRDEELQAYAQQVIEAVSGLGGRLRS